jgi:phage major head subunit gpT-like protein
MGASTLSSRSIIGDFYNILDAASGQNWTNLLSMRFDSNQASETYAWLGNVPAMREWVGGRQAKAFRENNYAIANKKFEATIEILVDELRRDKTGQVQIRLGELADRVIAHDAALLSDFILNGASRVCYDGQFYYDTDHTEGENSTNQSNSITFDISDNGSGGTPTAPTSTTAQLAIMNAVGQILGFRDDRNEPMNENARSFLVMASPSLFSPVMAAVGNPVLDSGRTNTITQMDGYTIQAVLNPRLTWTDKIAVFRTDGRAKPLIIQTEVPLEVGVQGEGSTEEFENDRWLVGAKKVGNAGYGFWQHSCLVTMQA